MKPADLLSLLQDVHRDKLALYRRHESGARQVSSYEFNNTYQYILNREDTHLAWLRSAIESFDAVPAGPVGELPVPEIGKGEGGAVPILDDDARTARRFVETWTPSLALVTHERHRKMLELMLGEVREHQRFFEQAAAGRQDLLGRRAGTGTGGGVMSTRWIE